MPFADSSGLLVLLLLLRMVLDDRCSGNEEDDRNKCCVLLLLLCVARRVSLPPPPTKLLRTKALRKIVVPRVPYEAIAMLLSAKRVDWRAKDWTTAKHSRIKGSDDGGMVQRNEGKWAVDRW